MSMSKCLSSVQEYAYKVFEASLKGLNEAKRAIADHLKNESLDGEVEWNPIGRAVTAMYCLLGIIVVVARFLLFAFLLRKGDNFDTELYFLMCGVLVLAFPVFSILNPGILFETKSQVALCIPMLTSSVGFFHVISTLAGESDHFLYSYGMMCLFFGLAPIMAVGLCLRDEDEGLLMAKLIKPCMKKKLDIDENDVSEV